MNQPSAIYGSFDIGGVTITSYAPASSEEERSWRIVAKREDTILVESRVPMQYEPRFGYDAADVINLEAATEELIKQLGLEG